MDVRFPYQGGGKIFFGSVYRPVAKVSFRSPHHNIWIETWMVVDTGADFSILPRYVAEDLSISLENECIKDLTFGVGGSEVIYLYKKKIQARIGALKRKVPLAFIDSNEVPPLLGRLGFLETFDTSFLKSRSVVFRG